MCISTQITDYSDNKRPADINY